MKLILTEIRTFKGKDGREWNTTNAFDPKTGEIVQLFLNAEQVETIKGIELVSLEALQEFVKQYTPVNVYFNSRGRVDSVSE